MCIDEESEHIILTAVRTFEYLANHLKAYSSLLEENLEQERSGMWDPHSPKIPRPEELDIDHYWGLEIFYPTTLRESLFVASFSHFESVMHELCTKIREVRQHSVTVFDLNGRGVARACKYLTKVSGLSIPNTDFASVMFLNRLRNLIVHNNSKVDAKNSEHQKLRKTAEEWSTVKIPQEGHIIFHSGFNKKALDAFVDFLDQLRKNNAR